MDKYDSYLEPTQPNIIQQQLDETQPAHTRKKRRGGCSRIFIWLLIALFIYSFAPFRSNVLVLGIDRTPEGTDIGRSDTIILLGVQPLTGQANMLSIPRDLWVPFPGMTRIVSMQLIPLASSNALDPDRS
jgi:hypothetical protein